MTTPIRWLAPLCLVLAVPALAGEPEPREGGHPFRMPPQEAQAACAALALGDACSFTFDGRAHQGVCRRGPEGQGPVACAPHRGPGGEKKEGGPGGKLGPEGGGGQGTAQR
jgi:hypothetical protein